MCNLAHISFIEFHHFHKPCSRRKPNGTYCRRNRFENYHRDYSDEDINHFGLHTTFEKIEKKERTRSPKRCRPAHCTLQNYIQLGQFSMKTIGIRQSLYFRGRSMIMTQRYFVSMPSQRIFAQGRNNKN